MGHCYGNDLRRRVVEAVTGGLSARGAAARFRLAPSTAELAPALARDGIGQTAWLEAGCA